MQKDLKIIKPEWADGKKLLKFWEDTMGYPVTNLKRMDYFAAKRLAKKYSIEIVENAITFYALYSAKEPKYCPRIDGFISLEQKWGTLCDIARREKAKEVSNNTTEVINL